MTTLGALPIRAAVYKVVKTKRDSTDPAGVAFLRGAGYRVRAAGHFLFPYLVLI